MAFPLKIVKGGGRHIAAYEKMMMIVQRFEDNEWLRSFFEVLIP